MIQTAEGSANEVANILKRMRELLVEGSSETLNSTERAYIQTELRALTSEVDRIAQVTEFNGINLFQESSGSPAPPVKMMNVQVGVHDSADDRIAIGLGNLDQMSMGAAAGVVSPPSVDTVTNARTAITTMDDIGDLLNKYRSGYGAVQNRLESALNNMETYTESLASAESQIRDADFAYETSQMAKNQTLQQAGVSILAQANGINQGALQLLQ